MPNFNQHEQRNTNAISGIDSQPLRAARNKSALFERQLHKFVNPRLVTSLNRRSAKAACETEKIYRTIRKLRKHAKKPDQSVQGKCKCLELMNKLKTMLIHQKNEWQCVGRLKETVAIADEMKCIVKFISQMTDLLDQAASCGPRRLSPERPPSYEITCGLTDDSFMTNQSQTVTSQRCNGAPRFDTSGNVLSSISPENSPNQGFGHCQSACSVSICLDDDDDDDDDDDGDCNYPDNCYDDDCDSDFEDRHRNERHTRCRQRRLRKSEQKRGSESRVKSVDRGSKRGKHQACGWSKSSRKVTRSKSDSQASCFTVRLTKSDSRDCKKLPHPRCSSPKKSKSIKMCTDDEPTSSRRSISSRHRTSSCKSETKSKSSSPKKQIIISTRGDKPRRSICEKSSDAKSDASQSRHSQRCCTESLSDIIERCVCKCLEKTMKSRSPKKSTMKQKDCDYQDRHHRRSYELGSKSISHSRTREYIIGSSNNSNCPPQNQLFMESFRSCSVPRMCKIREESRETVDAQEEINQSYSSPNLFIETSKNWFENKSDTQVTGIKHHKSPQRSQDIRQQHSQINTISSLSGVQQMDRQDNQPPLAKEPFVEDSSFIKSERLSPQETARSSLSQDGSPIDSNDPSDNNAIDTQHTSYFTAKSQIKHHNGTSSNDSIVTSKQSCTRAKYQPSTDRSSFHDLNPNESDMAVTGEASSTALGKLTPSFCLDGSNNRFTSYNGITDDTYSLSSNEITSKNNSHAKLDCGTKRKCCSCSCTCSCRSEEQSPKKLCGSRDKCHTPKKAIQTRKKECKSINSYSRERKSLAQYDENSDLECVSCCPNAPIAIELGDGESNLTICLEACSTNSSSTSQCTESRHDIRCETDGSNSCSTSNEEDCGDCDVSDDKHNDDDSGPQMVTSPRTSKSPTIYDDVSGPHTVTSLRSSKSPTIYDDESGPQTVTSPRTSKSPTIYDDVSGPHTVTSPRTSKSPTIYDDVSGPHTVTSLRSSKSPTIYDDESGPQTVTSPRTSKSPTIYDNDSGPQTMTSPRTSIGPVTPSSITEQSIRASSEKVMSMQEETLSSYETEASIRASSRKVMSIREVEPSWYETEDGVKDFFRRWWKLLLLLLLNLYILYVMCCIISSPNCGVCSVIPNVFRHFITSAKRSVRLIHYGTATF